MNTSVITIKKSENKFGWILAPIVFLVCSFFYSLQTGLLFGGLFLVTGVIRIRTERPWLGFLINGVWGVGCIFLSCWIPTIMTGGGADYLNIGIYRILMNFLCAAAVYGVFLILTGEVKKAVVLASAVLLILATVNDFVFQFRGNLLKPLDFLFVNTAKNVVSQYGIRIRESMAMGMLWWLWAVVSLKALPSAEGFLPKRWLRVVALLATAACVAVFAYGTRNIRSNNWSNEGVTRNGYLLNFTVGIRDCFVEPPEGYSEETIQMLEQRYAEGRSDSEDREKPNIIVIMNESYADFEVLGNDLRTNRPVTPFADSLKENTIRGYALTSIFGGTTANAEFEFLTGFSMANVPEGSCPYQQYINTDTFSLVQILKAQGYRTFATHPYLSSGWNRTNAYPRIGFDEMTFVEAYPAQDLLREYISDREMYGYVLDVLEENGEQPLFLFGITMQNHGDYIYTGDHYTQTIFLEDYEMEHPMAEQYLTVLNESDQAMEEFFLALEDYPEDTIVLFFGDHFPQVEGDFFLEVHGGAFETLPQQQLQYTIPFFLWANFDIPEQEVERTSLNYLSRYLLEQAGLELPAYYRFLEELETAIPSMNVDGYYSLSEGTYLPHSEAQGEEAQWLSWYADLQYNGLFGKENRSEYFWQTH